MTTILSALPGSAIFTSPRAYVSKPTVPLVEPLVVIGWSIKNGKAIPITSGASFEEINALYFVAFPGIDNIVTSDGDVFDDLGQWANACLDLAE